MFPGGVEIEHWIEMNKYYSLLLTITEKFKRCQYTNAASEAAIIILDTQNERSNAIISKRLNFIIFQKILTNALYGLKRYLKDATLNLSDHKAACSNHFVVSKPSYKEPNPTLYLVHSDTTKPPKNVKHLLEKSYCLPH